MESPGSAVERNASQAHNAVDDAARAAANKAGPVIDRAAQAAHRTIDRVAGAAAPAAEWMMQSAGQLRSQQDEVIETCRGYVRERPLATLCVALAAGYLIGRMR
jgi:ElaB/YqjD/DUF883 family membrane-anchored ribosome-binding protein